jgi:hypothetical protein
MKIIIFVNSTVEKETGFFFVCHFRHNEGTLVNNVI